jgi:hypothetical protein
MVKGLGMEEHDIIHVLELAKNNQLEYLQGKVEYLENQIFVLEDQKTKATNDILTLNRAINQSESSLPQKRGEEMAYMNQGRGWYDDTDNLYPILYSEPFTNSYSIQHYKESGEEEPNTSSYSIRLSYTDYWPW